MLNMYVISSKSKPKLDENQKSKLKPKPHQNQNFKTSFGFGACLYNADTNVRPDLSRTTMHFIFVHWITN
jgi:hypothetical protein